MLTIEEYIARRKKEDRLNEFDLNLRIENMKICANYVFEYFSNYLDITEAEERTALHDGKLEKYRKQLHHYDGEVADWLVKIYADYGKRVDLAIGNFLKQDEFFLLYNTDSDFRRLSYACYSEVIRKYPFIKEQTEMLFMFIKEYHRYQSRAGEFWDIPFFSDSLNGWVEETWRKYQIDVVGFAYRWVEIFSANPQIWPPAYKRRSKEEFIDYEYDHKQKSNLFNLDSLYRRMPKKPYTKGRKQEFEAIMMYEWLHSIEGDDDNYWDEYIEKTLPMLNSK